MKKGLNVEPDKNFRTRNILDLVGNTPLIKLNNITRDFKKVEVYAKLEWFNPGGSVKDRPALKMILDGERTGKLTKDKIILDSTSGNTGIAYAMIAAIKGYRVELVMPKNASEERKKILKAYGAEIIYTDPLEGTDGAIKEAHRRYMENPDKYFMPDQYNNPCNPLAHYESTGPEIILQTEGRITHFVAGVGTGGTIMGTGRRLKEFNKKIKVIGVEPDTSLHGIEGLKHMETAIIPGIFDEKFLDGIIKVKTEEAYECVKRLAREEGLLVGISSGAALAGVLQIIKDLDEGVIVTIFPDGGDKYLSSRLWEIY